MRELLERVQIPLRVAALIAVVYLGYVLIARHTADRRFAHGQSAAQPSAGQNAKFAEAYGGSDVKILQFYARESEITDDRSTVICYGVANARSVRVEPPLADIYPALNRCVEAAPRHDTKYVMTAEGNDGKTATAEVAIAVKPDLANRPRITGFDVIKHSYEQGRHYFTLGFSFQNASTVTIDPPVFRPIEDSAPFGQWTVTPEKTTTYTLTVADKKGRKASRQLTVEVPKS